MGSSTGLRTACGNQPPSSPLWTRLDLEGNARPLSQTPRRSHLSSFSGSGHEHASVCPRHARSGKSFTRQSDRAHEYMSGAEFLFFLLLSLPIFLARPRFVLREYRTLSHQRDCTAPKSSHLRRCSSAVTITPKYPPSSAYQEPGMRWFAILLNSISHGTDDPTIHILSCLF